MRFSGFSAIALLLSAASTFAQSGTGPTPPVAKKVHTEKPINGSVLVDDYAWLRERTSPAVHEYLEAENAYAEQSTAGEKPGRLGPRPVRSKTSPNSSSISRRMRSKLAKRSRSGISVISLPPGPR